MGDSFGRWARAVLLVGMIALAGMSIIGVQGVSPSTTIAFAGPVASNGNGNDNHGDPTSDDNNDERILRGQVLELHDELSPPEVLVATTGENVRARLFNDQLHRSGVRAGDHVRLQGEYGPIKGIFDAYEVDVQDRCCPGPNNNNGNGNGNDNG